MIASGWQAKPIFSHISGLLLNPNSKYEANFIPLHTLADWHNPSRPKISTCGEKATRPGTDPEKYRYDPEAALKEAMDDWVCIQQA